VRLTLKSFFDPLKKETLSAVETRKLIVTVGAALVVLGVFSPILTFPESTASYLGRHPAEGYFLLGASVVAWILALANKYFLSWVTGMIALIDLAFAAFGLWHEKAVDPAYMKGVSPGFGFVVLTLGALALIISARLKSSQSENR